MLLNDVQQRNNIKYINIRQFSSAAGYNTCGRAEYLREGRIPAGGPNTCGSVAAEVAEYCETTFD